MGSSDGRVVIVTGAARGLGRAHALAFAADGARVLVNDLGVERDGSAGTSDAANEVVDEIVAAGGEAVANAADVADWDQAKAMVHQAIDTWGRRPWPQSESAPVPLPEIAALRWAQPRSRKSLP